MTNMNIFHTFSYIFYTFYFFIIYILYFIINYISFIFLLMACSLIKKCHPIKFQFFYKINFNVFNFLQLTPSNIKVIKLNSEILCLASLRAIPFGGSTQVVK